MRWQYSSNRPISISSEEFLCRSGLRQIGRFDRKKIIPEAIRVRYRPLVSQNLHVFEIREYAQKKEREILSQMMYLSQNRKFC